MGNKVISYINNGLYGKQVNLNLYFIQCKIWWNNAESDKSKKSWCITIFKNKNDIFKLFYHYHKDQHFLSRFEYSVGRGAWSRFKEYKFN